MKKIIYTFTIIIFFSSNIFSQGGNKGQKRTEIIKKQNEFIISELQLTEKEKKAFIPLFKEYNLKKEDLFNKKRKKMQYFRKNSLNMTEQELENLADFFVDTDVEIAQLGKTYNDKFKKILPPIKVILLHQAEQQFKRQLFKQMKHKGQKQNTLR